MEGIGGQLRAIVNGRIGLTPLQPGQLPTLQTSTQPVQTLTPLQPGQLPVLTDPNVTGYANPAFAAVFNQYVNEKAALLNEARAATEKAMRDADNADAAAKNYKAAAVGVGIVLVAIKFLL